MSGCGVEQEKGNGIRRAIALALALAATVFGLAVASQGAQAATPTILNGSNWLENTFSVGETNNSGNRVWLSLAVKHDVGRKVTGIKIDDDWNGTDNTTSKTVKAVTAQQPTIQGGYDHSRVSFNYQFPTSDTGMSCGAFGVGGTNKATKQIRVRAVLDNGDETATSTDDIIFTRADCSGGEDFPYLYQRSQTATSINTGQSVTFTFRGDDSDSNGNADFAGINWRLRRSSDGTTTSVTKRCYSSPFDNTDKTLAVTFPDRGRWIVEAELLNNSGCNVNNNAGAWTYIGAVDVNSPAADSPTASLSATRPQINGNSTVTATFSDPDDSAAGGRVQNAEWDLDNNTTNGQGGFEVADLGTWNANLSSPRSKTVNTTGMSPGLKTVRVRVGDNGALVGADTIRRTKIATATYLVDTPPVATDGNATARSGDAKEIALAGTDVDEDTLTFAAGTQPEHGTLTVSGSTATYTPDVGFAGTDSFTFIANDGYGGTDTGNVTVDVAPSTSIDDPTPDAVATGEAEFTFSSQVSGTTFECRLDPGPDSEWEDCESPYAATGLSEGPHTFQVRSTVNGVTDPSPAEHVVTVYLTPPVTSIDSGPNGTIGTGSPEWTFSSNVPGSTFECSLDQGDGFTVWEDCESPFGYEDLIGGPFTFGVRAIDPAGNVDPDPPVRNFWIDQTAPETILIDAPVAISDSPDASFAFSADDPEATFECQLDDGAWAVCESPREYVGLEQGSHVFSVRAVDAVENRDATPVVHEWIVDSVDPVVTIDTAPAAVVNSPDFSFQFSADEDVTFQCAIDNGEWYSCDSPEDVNVSGDGLHLFQLMATDAAGNVGEREVIWEVDTQAPEATIDSGPAPNSNGEDIAFEFSANEPGSVFECRLDSSEDLDWQSCVSPVAYSDLAEGDHVFEVRAKDAVGNAGPADSFDFSVDASAPDLTIDSAPDAVSGATGAAFDFSSSDPEATFECRLDGSAGDPFEPCESPKTYADLPAGSHAFSVIAIDPAGNRSEPETHEWEIDLTAPVTTITAHPADPTNSDQATFEFSADTPDTSFECRLDPEEGSAWLPCDTGQAYTGLSEGRHTFEVRGTDQQGNVATESVQWSWTVDLTAPAAEISSAPAALSNQELAEFAFGTDEAATFDCRVDSDQPADWQDCESPLQIGSLNEGGHSFEVRATDLAGNTGPVESRNWTVDLTAPVTEITAQPDEFTNQTGATLEFESGDADASFTCSIDDSEFTACASPQSYSGLGQGDHTFRVRATDPAGNAGPVDAATWRIILTPPTATIDAAPPALTNSPTANFQFSSDDDQATFECRVDSAEESAWADCESPKQLTGLADGEHTFEVRATDGLGNVSEVASHDWTVDLAAPAVAIDSTHASLTNEDSISIEFSSADATATFECKLDQGAWQDCSSPFEGTGLSEGDHTFLVRATDPAGNTGAEQSVAWEIDLTDPVAEIDQAPPALTNSDAATFEFSGTETGTFQCRVDSSDDADWEDCSSPLELTNLSEGGHTFEVRQTDDAGNVGPIDGHEWTIDLTAPVATIDAAPETLTNDEEATFEFSSGDASDDFECRLDSDQETAWEACVSPEDLTGLTDDVHRFEVRAIDEAGNVGPVDGHEWTVDLESPTTSITSAPAELTNEPEATFEFGSSDSEATFECRLGAGAQGEWEACESPVTYEDLTDGAHTFAVRATDTAGNVGDEANHSWDVDLTPPVLTIDSGPEARTNAVAAELTFHANESGTTFECRLDSTEDDAWEACESPASYVELDDGTHLFELRGTDPAGNTATVGATWVIDTVRPVTTISAAPPAATRNRAATFEFTSDKTDSTFECRIDSTDPGDWDSCQSGVSYGSLDDGDHRFEVRATDPLGNEGDTAAHEWTVDNVLPVTDITSGPPATTNAKSAEFTFTADKAGSTFECRLDGDGDDAWTDCDSGVSYVGLDEGQHLFEVRATDQLDNRGPADSLSWEIDSVLPVTTIDSAPAGPTPATSAEFTFSANRTVAGYECRIDSEEDQDWESCVSPKTVSGLADGEHRFQVRSTSTVAGVGPVASHVWTVDTVAPDVTIAAGPAAKTRETGARFEFGSPDATADLSCRLDSDLPGDWQACDSPRSLSGLPDGAHTFEVRAVDEAGNAKVASRSWTIDTAAPTVTIGKKPAASTKETAAIFEFTADKAGSRFECALDDGAWQACTSPASVGPLAVGEHRFAVRATDPLGNVSPAETHAWTISVIDGPKPPPADPKPPVVTGMKKVKLLASGKAKIATLSCPEGTCAVTGPKQITVKVGKKKFKVKVVRPSSIAAGKGAPVRIVLPKAALKAIGKRKLRVKVKVTVTSSNGESVTRTIKVNLRGNKGGRKK